MTWRFAASTGCCIDQPVFATLDALHRAGITAVELGTPPKHFDPWHHDQVMALRDRLRELAIEPVAIHAPFGGLLDLSDGNPHHRHATIGAILAAASAVREVGGSRIVVHLTDVPRAGQRVAERLANCTKAIRVLTRTLAQMQVTLLLETPLPHLIGGHPDEFAEVVLPLDPAVRVCVDTSHTTLGGHWDRFLDLIGDRVTHVHANDHHGRFDDHLPPGEGVIDWHHIASSLRRVGFDGWIVLELKCPAAPMTMHFDAAMRRARKLLA